jgi:anti-anti-sigma factor
MRTTDEGEGRSMGVDFNYEAREVNGHAVVALPGEYDLTNCARVEAALVALVGDQPHIVIDLSETAYIDSTALTMFLRLNRTWGGRLSLIVPPDSIVYRVFDVTGLGEIFKIDPSLEAATGQPGAA